MQTQLYNGQQTQQQQYRYSVMVFCMCSNGASLSGSGCTVAILASSKSRQVHVTACSMEQVASNFVWTIIWWQAVHRIEIYVMRPPSCMTSISAQQVSRRLTRDGMAWSGIFPEKQNAWPWRLNYIESKLGLSMILWRHPRDIAWPVCQSIWVREKLLAKCAVERTAGSVTYQKHLSHFYVISPIEVNAYDYLRWENLQVFLGRSQLIIFHSHLQHNRASNAVHIVFINLATDKRYGDSLNNIVPENVTRNRSQKSVWNGQVRRCICCHVRYSGLDITH